MIHEFTVKSGSASIIIHVAARTREEAIELLKDDLINKKINLQINEECSISITILNFEEKTAENEFVIPLQQIPSQRIKKDGRYFSVRESYIGRLAPKTTPPEELLSNVPEDEEELTKPDNPVAIRRSSNKMKAVK
ncbi:MAG TPA: hypothetical protein VMX17_06420 [Candidatus Glassbacteria bacterium]|nr:hypothetical protein [Candidatus Glassbacteria bacterium]